MEEHNLLQSKGNHGEVGLVKIHITRLTNAGVKQNEIAVLTPYKLQVELITQSLQGRFPAVEIKTIDNFQGREKETIILSLVRSNGKKQIGFLEDTRRLTVALTRARRHLAIICNSRMAQGNKHLEEFIKYIKEVGITETPLEFLRELQEMTKQYHILKRGKTLQDEEIEERNITTPIIVGPHDWQ